MARQRQGWHPEDIRAAVRKRHGTVRALAERSGYTLTALCYAINGRVFVPGPCAVVAEAIEIAPALLWPQWFHPDGTPRQGRAATDAKSKPSRRRRHVQSRATAA